MEAERNPETEEDPDKRLGMGIPNTFRPPDQGTY